jgi:hypothetical protein
MPGIPNSYDQCEPKISGTKHPYTKQYMEVINFQDFVRVFYYKYKNVERNNAGLLKGL